MILTSFERRFIAKELEATFAEVCVDTGLANVTVSLEAKHSSAAITACSVYQVAVYQVAIPLGHILFKRNGCRWQVTKKQKDMA